MLYMPPRTGHAPRALQVITLLTAALAVYGCGGGDDAAVSVPPPITPPSTVSTTITGAVVKGPVDGAQVCAYTVVTNARGTALGSCTTTDASGSYTLAVPIDSGSLWVEATGGTYTDETTAAAATLPAGSPLRALITANGGSVSTMLTPLTTLALNAAAATAGASGTLDATAFSTAAAQLLAAFNLPGTLNISTTQPTFGSDINSYGTALTAISQMVANGSTLASILAATQPSALAAAYAAAASPPVTTTPPPPPSPTSGGAPSASGTVTATGAVAGSITPEATGYEVTTTAGSTTHRFFLLGVQVAGYAAGVTSYAEIIVTRSPTATTVRYGDPRVTLIPASCDARVSTTCGVTLSTPAGATHPVTVTLTDTPLVGGGTLNGTLVGDAPGAAWVPADLPRSTDGTVSIGGAASAVSSSTFSSSTAPGANLLSVILSLADGTQLSVNRVNSNPINVVRIGPNITAQTCATACKVGLAESAEGTVVTFDSTPLDGGTTIGGSVFVGKTQGSLTNNGSLGSFTPGSDTVTATNDARTFTFSTLGTPAQANISLLTLTARNGRVTSATATVGIGQAIYTCGDGLTVLGYPACSGITVGANGRSLTFTSATLAGGALGAAKTDVSFNGTLTAKGL